MRVLFKTIYLSIFTLLSFLTRCFVKSIFYTYKLSDIIYRIEIIIFKQKYILLFQFFNIGLNRIKYGTLVK